MFRLIKRGEVSILAIVRANGSLPAICESRCDGFGEDLNRLAPTNNLGDLAGLIYWLLFQEGHS